MCTWYDLPTALCSHQCQFPSVLSKRSQSTDIFFKKQKKWLDVKADWLAAPLKRAKHTVFSRISEEISGSSGVKKSHNNGKDTLKKHLNYLICSRNSRPPTLFILHLLSKCVSSQDLSSNPAAVLTSFNKYLMFLSFSVLRCKMRIPATFYTGAKGYIK